MEYHTHPIGTAEPNLPQSIVTKAETSKNVLIVLQYTERFSTNHQLLDEYPCTKIVLINRASHVLDMPALAHYDLIATYPGPVWYDSETGNLSWASDPDNEVILPELYAAACEVLDILTTTLEGKGVTIRLTTATEESMMQMAFLNKKYSLPGLQPDKMQYLVSKERMMERCAEYGKYGTKSIDFRLSTDAKPIEIAQRIEDHLDYPIFVKPVAGSAAIGAAKLVNRDNLLTWINKSIEDEECLIKNYIAQEYLDGPMFLTETFVTSDHELIFLCATKTIGQWFSLVTDLKPAAGIYLTPDCPNWNDLKQVSIDLITAFNCVTNPGVYIIEVIQSPRGYQLLEIMCRPDSGASENLLAEEITGIDPEAAHFMAPFITKAQLLKMLKPAAAQTSGGSVWYPRKPGTVAKNVALDPAILPSGCEIIMTRHCFQPGDKCLAPYVCCDLRCELFFRAKTFQAAVECAEKLLQFDPVLMTD